jgi:hypothetical protein
MIHQYLIHLKQNKKNNKVSLKIIYQIHLKYKIILLQQKQRLKMKVKLKYNKIKMTIINQKVATHFLLKAIFQRVIKKVQLNPTNSGWVQSNFRDLGGS